MRAVPGQDSLLYARLIPYSLISISFFFFYVIVSILCPIGIGILIFSKLLQDIDQSVSRR